MTILEKLKKYFEENSKEQIEADWKETKKFDNVDSPNVEQFLLYNVGSTFVCNYCLEKVSELPDNFGCQSCIDKYK